MNQNVRNFQHKSGKVAPLQPVGNHPIGLVSDQARARQWVDPYEFWSNARYWHRKGGNYSQAFKDRADAWVESLKGQKSIRPTTVTGEHLDAIRKEVERLNKSK